MTLLVCNSRKSLLTTKVTKNNGEIFMNKIVLAASITVLGFFARANDSSEDFLSGVKYNDFYVHPSIPNTLLFIEEYGGPTRFTATTDSAKNYISNLEAGVAYSCSFSGRSAPCEGGISSLRGCSVVPNKILFESALCLAK